MTSGNFITIFLFACVTYLILTGIFDRFRIRDVERQLRELERKRAELDRRASALRDGTRADE